ncbi:MAG TPA: thioredoxin family protein [Candidatus Dormibacteraeota bacterium]|nr:thioredoxin family protein [Candidatus Dormibacteraeota bacterium]
MGPEAASAGLPDLTAAELEALLGEEERLVLVSFWSPRCEPCRELRRELEGLRARGEGVCRLVAVDVEREPEAALRHGVREVPLLVFFKRGIELHRFRGGALPASTRRLLEGTVGATSRSGPGPGRPGAGRP